MGHRPREENTSRGGAGFPRASILRRGRFPRHNLAASDQPPPPHHLNAPPRFTTSLHHPPLHRHAIYPPLNPPPAVPPSSADWRRKKKKESKRRRKKEAITASLFSSSLLDPLTSTTSDPPTSLPPFPFASHPVYLSRNYTNLRHHSPSLTTTRRRRSSPAENVKKKCEEEEETCRLCAHRLTSLTNPALTDPPLPSAGGSPPIPETTPHSQTRVSDRIVKLFAIDLEGQKGENISLSGQTLLKALANCSLIDLASHRLEKIDACSAECEVNIAQEWLEKLSAASYDEQYVLKRNSRNRVLNKHSRLGCQVVLNKELEGMVVAVSEPKSWEIL